MAKIGLIVSLVAAIFIGYKINNEYFPDELSHPLLMKTLLSTGRMVDNVVLLLDRIGVVDFITAKRKVTEFMWSGLSRSDPDIQIEDVTVDDIPVRIYRPKGHSKDDRRRCMVYYHGGGWVFFNPEDYDAVTSYFSKEVDMVVISVRYRLNPEYSQKDGLDDCVSVTKRVIQRAEDYGIDPERVVIAGDSAGGNYAAAVSLVLRDEHFTPMPKIQLLIYPVLQAVDLMLPSYQQNAAGPLLNCGLMCWFFSHLYAKNDSYILYFETNTHLPGYVRQHYANDLLNHNNLPPKNRYDPYVPPNYDSGDSEIWDAIKDNILDPYHFPLMANNFEGLPDTYLFTCQYDVLRDEGYLYAGVLREAGVKMTHYHSPVGWHGIINFLNVNNDSLGVMKRMCAFLHENL